MSSPIVHEKMEVYRTEFVVMRDLGDPHTQFTSTENDLYIGNRRDLGG